MITMMLIAGGPSALLTLSFVALGRSSKVSFSRIHFSSPHAVRAGPKVCALRARGCYWQTVPPQWGGGRFFGASANFCNENSCNSETKNRPEKIKKKSYMSFHLHSTSSVVDRSRLADILSSPRAKRTGPKGLRAESARAVTGRRCPHSALCVYPH